jgi:hypothetical protein
MVIDEHERPLARGRLMGQLHHLPDIFELALQVGVETGPHTTSIAGSGHRVTKYRGAIPYRFLVRDSLAHITPIRHMPTRADGEPFAVDAARCRNGLTKVVSFDC